MLRLVRSTYGGSAMCFTCNLCGLIAVTLCIKMIIALSANYFIYWDDVCSELYEVFIHILVIKVKECVLLGHHVKL